MIHTIFLDLDDVLNTLAPCVLNAVGCPIESNDYSKIPREFGFAMEKVANYMIGTKYTWKTFWNTIPQQVWANVPRSDFFDWIIKACEIAVGQKNVFIATRPTDEPDCAAGKMEWMHTNLPSWLHRQFVITPCKWLLAQSYTLLIDDLDDNVTRFQKRGGHAILVPRPWNWLHSRGNPQPCIAEQMAAFHFPMRGLE
jgi:5'(3')-deoxyribonucleotidase